jgi:hypothetical protein
MRRRRARSALKFLFDDDLVTPEEGWPQPPLLETMAENDSPQRRLALASDDTGDR